MICRNCGSKIKDGSEFCSGCGVKIDNLNNQGTSVNRVIENSDSGNVLSNSGSNLINNNSVNNKENNELIKEMSKAYIGYDKYDVFAKGGFSWCAFLLGWMYYLYRKLYKKGLMAVAVSVIILIISIWLDYFFVLIISIIFGLFLSLNFKKWYIEEVEERVKIIYKENINLPVNKLIEISAKRGGTDYKGIFFALVYNMLVSLIVIYFAMSSIANYSREFVQISRESIDGFTDVYSDSYVSYGYEVARSVYSYEDANDKCELIYYITNGYTLNDYSSIYNASLDYYATVVDVSDTNEVLLRTVNDIEFYDYESDDIYYTFTTGNYNATIIKFSVLKNTTGKCLTYKDDIFSKLHYRG